MHARISSTHFISYRLGGRKNSVLVLQDPSGENAEEFTQAEDVKEIRTIFNIVRTFKSPEGGRLIVKAPLTDLEESSFNTEKDFLKKCGSRHYDMAREVELLQRAYPDEDPCYLQAGLITSATGSCWTYRMIMPFVSGGVLGQFVSEISDPLILLTFILAVSMELDRIHRLGIIHGDVHYANVLAEVAEEKAGVAVHFIDFGRAYAVDDKEATFTRDEKADRWAPERRVGVDQRGPVPDVSQDVYSLGYMLTELRDDFISPGAQQLKNYFPVLFMERSQQTDPAERPGLEELMAQVKDDIETLNQTPALSRQ